MKYENLKLLAVLVLRAYCFQPVGPHKFLLREKGKTSCG